MDIIKVLKFEWRICVYIYRDKEREKRWMDKDPLVRCTIIQSCQRSLYSWFRTLIQHLSEAYNTLGDSNAPTGAYTYSSSIMTQHFSIPFSNIFVRTYADQLLCKRLLTGSDRKFFRNETSFYLSRRIKVRIFDLSFNNCLIFLLLSIVIINSLISDIYI